MNVYRCMAARVAVGVRHALSSRSLFTLPTLNADLRCGLPPLFTPEQLQCVRRQHQLVVERLNEHLLAEPRFDNQPLETVIKSTHFDATHSAIYNYASQHWNMCFFTKCLGQQGTEQDTQAQMEHVAEQMKLLFVNFESLSVLEEQVKEHIVNSFGSGWVWLAADPEGKLKVIVTSGADTPMLAGHIPLLGASVWEHAYLLDYREDKQAYADAFWRCVNWPFVSSVLRLLPAAPPPQ
eukprot:EG_transcript_18831